MSQNEIFEQSVKSTLDEWDKRWTDSREERKYIEPEHATAGRFLSNVKKALIDMHKIVDPESKLQKHSPYLEYLCKYFIKAEVEFEGKSAQPFTHFINDQLEEINTNCVVRGDISKDALFVLDDTNSMNALATHLGKYEALKELEKKFENKSRANMVVVADDLAAENLASRKSGKRKSDQISLICFPSGSAFRISGEGPSTFIFILSISDSLTSSL